MNTAVFAKNSSKKELEGYFGAEEPDPEGVEYFKLDGITIMTYYRHVIACGIDSDLCA